MELLATLDESLWLYAALPLLGVAALVMTVVLRAPQVTRWRDGVRALSDDDENARGDVSPLTAFLWSTTAAYGAAAALGAATAVSLGGPGALVWAWVFALVISPLRYGEVLLARTRASGSKGERGYGLATRMMQSKRTRVVGFALLGLSGLVAVVYGGAVHGVGATDSLSELLPKEQHLGSGLLLSAVAAVLAVLVCVKARTAQYLGLFALVCFATILIALGISIAQDPRTAFSALGRGLSETISGAPKASDAFLGAGAGEIARHAALHFLAPLTASSSTDAAWHGRAHARTTRGQAAAAALSPFVYALATTLLVMAMVAGDGFYAARETTRTLAEADPYQRADGKPIRSLFDAERATGFDGYLSVTQGEARTRGVYFRTDVGHIAAPRFEYYGSPAHLTFHYDDGKLIRLMRTMNQGQWEEIPLEQAHHVIIRGRMLPTGSAAVAQQSVDSKSVQAHMLLIALALLGLLAVAAFGAGLWRLWPSKRREVVAVAALPACLMALSLIFPVLPWGGIASIAAGLFTCITALSLLAHAKELATLNAATAAKVAK